MNKLAIHLKRELERSNMAEAHQETCVNRVNNYDAMLQGLQSAIFYLEHAGGQSDTLELLEALNQIFTKAEEL